MGKRVKVSGYIELPDAAELPEIGSTISGTYRAEVDAHVDLREKRRAESSRITHTARATIVDDGATMATIEPPVDQPSLEDEEAASGDDGEGDDE